MLKPAGKDVSMLQFKERHIGIEAKPKPYSSWSRKLIAGTIFTTYIASQVLFPSLAWAKSKKTAKEETKIIDTKDFYSKIISTEAYVTDSDNKSYNLKIENKPETNYLIAYVDGKYCSKANLEQFITENFSEKFTNREIIMGNPSFIVKGIDGNGCYGYLLFDWNNGNITPINSGFHVEIWKRVGVNVKCIFDENSREWKFSYQKERKEIASTRFSENGKKLGTSGMSDLFILYKKAVKNK